MKIELNSNEIHEILKLSKAESISFINVNSKTYVVAHDQDDIAFKNQIVKKIYGYGESGQTVIDKDVLKLVPKDTLVTITEDTIVAGKRKIKYTANSLTDEIKDIGNLLTTVKSNELDHLLNCEYAIAEDQTRPVLNGICINNGEFTALDGFRLAIRKGEFETKEQVVMNTDMVKILKKVKYKGAINIYYNDNYVKFKFGDLEVIGNRIQGDYINYKLIIPEDYTTGVTLETKTLLNILKDYKKNKFELVKLNFQKDKLIVNANNKIAEVEESLNIKLQGKPLEIAFNLNYLFHTLKNYKNASLELTTCVSPIVVKEENKLDLVLPVRLRKQ